MHRVLIAALIAALGVGFVATDAEAKRLGGGMSQGMKRQTPPPRTPDTPATPAATPGATANAKPAAAAAAPAVAPKRSWMGPIAGLAAGLGIAALMSHLGLGAAFGNFIMMALLAVVAFIAIRFVMSRMRPRQNMATAGGPAMPVGDFGKPTEMKPQPIALAQAAPVIAPAPALAVASSSGSPSGASTGGLDTVAFERIAKLIFIRMQAANDSGDVEDLRQFATPEMFAAFKLDLQERQGTQRTDIVKLDTEVLESAVEAGHQIVSVRFHGQLREEPGAAATPFDETWHLTKPADGVSTQWLIAGILQNA